MNFMLWLIVGAIIGWVANSVVEAPGGLLVNLIVGMVGAVVTGLVLTPLWGIGTLNQNTFSLPAMLLSAVGAITLLAALNLLYRRVSLPLEKL